MDKIQKIKWCIIFFMLLGLGQLIYAQQQTVMIKGMIVDENNEPIIGATILEKGTNNGTISDYNGNFTLNVNPGSTVQISYVGYDNLEFKANSIPEIIIMKESSLALSEVVVTGYTTERKADLTGSVTVVDMEEIVSIPTGNILSSLQGRVSGMNVSTDGTPGGINTSALIRGQTTFGNNTPLYVIDGVMTRDNIAHIISANDVESIQVLKDAASASIYGTQASNGVIIITTKRAKKGEIKVDFDMSLTNQVYHSPIKMLNAAQWGEVYWKAYQNIGLKPSHDLYGNGEKPVIPEYIYYVEGEAPIRSGDTDWAKVIYNQALMQNYNVTMARGSDNGSSSLSFNFLDHDGIIMHTNFSRFNTRLTSDYQFLDNRLRIGESIAVNRWTQVLKAGGIEELVIAQHPIIPVYDEEGGYAGPTYGIGDKPNPVRLMDNQKNNRREYWRIFGNGYIEIEPLNNLVLKTNFGINYYNAFESDFVPKWHEGNRSVDKNELTVSNNYSREWVWSNTVAYNFNIDRHSASFLSGMEAKEFYSESLTGYRSSFLLETKDFRYLNAGGDNQRNGNIASRTAMLSYFAKANYSYDSRYLLSATIRRDASSRFGVNNNYGIFPSVSAGWRLSQEAFMENVDWLTDLKLRSSWGKNGNDLIDNEATYTKYLIDITRAGYDITGSNSSIIPGVIKSRSGNPNIAWESTIQFNLGIDAAFLNNRLGMTLDWFNKDTKDILIDRPYIAVIGEGGTYAYNGASMNNKGIEAMLTWRNRNNDFGYEVNFNFSYYKNKVTDLPEDIYYTAYGGNGRDLSIVGQPFGSWMGYKTDGLYRTQEEIDNGPLQPGKGLGRIRYVDISGPDGEPDGVINDFDRTWLGTDLPKVIGGLNLSFTYKQFDMSMFFNGMIRKAYNNAKYYTDFFQLWTGNHSTRLLNAWDPESNFNSTIPALTPVNTNDEGRTSEYFIENGNYIKMKNLQIGYTLPSRFAQRIKLQNARIYIQGQNLFTITNYNGADPEGLGYPYPMPRTYTVGLNIGL
jgi:TonB-linked SusC/RagA family outer membrane protein